MRSIVELIAVKRDGGALTSEEIRWAIGGWLRGEWADYQMSALLMAILIRGFNEVEMSALTEAMVASGEKVDLSDVAAAKVDKHSTGGVGDKVSIALAPLVAGCGVAVPMVCGRGLGHTGGTIDKLEAIPGLRTDLTLAAFADTVRKVGVAIMGQTDALAPADRRLYALRDVTGTVESIPLIVASILSKKLAEGADAWVFDVKIGRGAFMADLSDAEKLARALLRGVERAGGRGAAYLTAMDAPLGRQVGNANEVREALGLLQGDATEDLMECTLLLGSEMLVLGKVVKDLDEGRARLRRAMSTGEGVAAMERMVAAQGGDPAVVSNPMRLPSAPIEWGVKSEKRGWIASIDARAIGQIAVSIGAGRKQLGDPIDPVVGISIDAKPGEDVYPGDRLATILLRHTSDAQRVEQAVRHAFVMSEEKVDAQPVFLGKIAQTDAVER